MQMLHRFATVRKLGAQGLEAGTERENGGAYLSNNFTQPELRLGILLRINVHIRRLPYLAPPKHLWLVCASARASTRSGGSIDNVS